MRFAGSLFLALLWLTFALLSPAHAGPTRNARPLTLGIVPYTSTRNLLTTHQSLARSLKRPAATGTNRHRTDYDSFVRRLAGGECDIVISLPAYARLAIRDFGYNALLVHKAPIPRHLGHGASDAPKRSRRPARQAHCRRRSQCPDGHPRHGDASRNGIQESRDYQFVREPSAMPAPAKCALGQILVLRLRTSPG